MLSRRSLLSFNRCILMTTDPGDLVLDPTCGSGTTAYVPEHWGRRWITIDTSRVAVALARSRLMARAKSLLPAGRQPEGQAKEGEITRTPPKTTPTPRQHTARASSYDRVPHIQRLKSIANNAEIDVIWDRMQPAVEEAIAALNNALRGHATQFKARNRRPERARRSTSPPPARPRCPRRARARGWPDGMGNSARGACGLAANPQKHALATFWEARIVPASARSTPASPPRLISNYLYDKPFPRQGQGARGWPPSPSNPSRPTRTLAVDRTTS